MHLLPRHLALALLLAAGMPASAQQVVEQDGVRIELQVQGERGALVEGQEAQIELRLTQAGTGEPLTVQRPAAWLDAGAAAGGSCRERVSRYLQGSVGSRPLVDLNGYYLLVLNRDPSISVIDPVVGIGGRTSLRTSIVLPHPGADWDEHLGRRRLAVTLPRADRLALVDTEGLRLAGLVPTGRQPVRVAVQQRGPLAFTGNDGDGTVTAVDLGSGKAVATLRVGRGHHELQLVEDAARLFVSHQGDRSLSVVDTAALAVIRTLPLAGVPTSLAHAPLAGAVYVAHGGDGQVQALDQGSGEPRGLVTLGTPVNALAVTPDGRSLLALATDAHTLFVLDSADLSLRHRIALPGAPYQVAFSGGYAHVRLYDTERVALLATAALAGTGAPLPGGYAAGTGAPTRANVAVLAPGLAGMPDGMGTVVANPADGRLHVHLEGMNAIAGTFRNYGHPPQAVRATVRSLRETAPGRHAARLRLPVAGTLSLAVRLEQPRVAACFDLVVQRNPTLAPGDAPLRASLADASPLPAPAAAHALRVSVRSEDGTPADLPAGAQLRYYRAPGLDRRSAGLRRVGPGEYEATLDLTAAGAWYLWLEPSGGVQPPFLTLLVRPG